MSFESTKIEFKKIPVLPVLSYSGVVLLTGFVLKEISGFGNMSYIITTVGLPLIAGHVDRFTEGSLLAALRKDWVKLSPTEHIFIIINCLIIFYLTKLILITKDSLWTPKTPNNL